MIGVATADPSSLPSDTQTGESATVLYTTSQEQKQPSSAPSSSSSDGKGAVNMSIVSAFQRHIGLSYIPVKDRRRIVNGVIDHFKSLLFVLIESPDEVSDADNSAWRRLLPLLETIDIDTWADQFYGYTTYSMLTCLHYQLSHLFESHSSSLYTSLDVAVQTSRGDTGSRYDDSTSDIAKNSTIKQKLVYYDHISGVLSSLQTSTIGFNLALDPSSLPGHLLQIPCLASTTTQRALPPPAGAAEAFSLPSSSSRTAFSVKGKCLRFADIAGHNAIKQQLTEAIMWARWYPALYTAFSTAADTGVLLFGPPGSGKEAYQNTITCVYSKQLINCIV